MLYIRGEKVKRLHRRRTFRELGRRRWFLWLNELGQAKLILYLPYIAYPGGIHPKIHIYPKLFNTPLKVHLEPPLLMLNSLSMHCAPQEIISLSEHQVFLVNLLHLLSDHFFKKPLKLLTKEPQSMDSPGSQTTSPSRFRDETLHTMDPSELQETAKLSLQKARRSIHELKEKNAELENDMETHRSLLATTETELREVHMRMQSLSKTLKARDEEAKGLVAKLTILENSRADSAKDAERIRILRLALEQGKQETKAIKMDMDIAQTTIITERQAKSRAETSVRALRAEIVILRAETIELRRRATEELDPSGLGHEGQRSYVNAQIEELRELREVRDEQNATIKNQERELRKFEILKQKLCHLNIELVEEVELDLSKSGLAKQSTKVDEEPRNVYASPSSSRSGSECGDLSLNLREQLGAFGEHYNSGSSVSSSPAMTEASDFSSPFKTEFTDRDRRAGHATLPTTKGEELYTYLGEEAPAPEEPQDYGSGDKSPKRIGRHGRTEIQVTTSSLGDNGHQKSKDKLSSVTTLSSEEEGSDTCTKDEQPDSQRPTKCGKGEDISRIFTCAEQRAGQQLLTFTSENEEERLKDKELLSPQLITGGIGLGIFIRDEAPSQHCLEDKCLTDVTHLKHSATRNTEFTPDEQTKCKDETSSPSTFALEDEDQDELSPALDSFNCDDKNEPSIRKPEGRRKESSHVEAEKYICYHDDKLSVLESWKFEDNKKLGVGTLFEQSSALTASKIYVSTSANQSTPITHLQRQTTSTQTDRILVSEKMPALHSTETTTTISSGSPCPHSALSSFRACFNSLIHHHPFLSLLYLLFHCLFLILPFLYALTAGFAADRERRMWLSGSEVTRRAAVALGQGSWEGGYWDDFMDMISA